MAAPDVAAAMDMDIDAGLAAPQADVYLLRSRLSGDVRERLGLPRTPAPVELPRLPDPGRVRRVRLRARALDARAPAFAALTLRPRCAAAAFRPA
jgi:hypothetical protein